MLLKRIGLCGAALAALASSSPPSAHAETAATPAQPEVPVDVTILETVNLPWQEPEVIVKSGAVERLHVEVVIDAAAGPVIDAVDVPEHFTRSLTWPAKVGRHKCEVRVTGVRNGDSFRRVWSSGIDVVPPMQVDFGPGNVDLPTRTLRFRTKSDVSFVELSIFDVDGRVLHQATTAFDDDKPGKSITLTWPELSAPLAKLAMRVFSTSDSWADVEWSPIQIEVPHDPIFFRDTVVLGSRADKMNAAYQAVKRVAEDYAGVPNLRLYVMGMASGSDKMEYAVDRARAVAKYFEAHGGVGLPILIGASVDPESSASDPGYVQAFVAVDEPAKSPWIQITQ